MWTVKSASTNYGNMPIADGYSKRIHSHRASWLIHYGSIPDGLWVLHKCDRMGCVNPLHLFLGTGRDNSLDKERKQRGNHPAGERNHSVLNWDKVREVRRLKATDHLTYVELSRRFGVSANTMRLIVHNKKWKE